jgi:hypothetical protein
LLILKFPRNTIDDGESSQQSLSIRIQRHWTNSPARCSITMHKLNPPIHEIAFQRIVSNVTIPKTLRQKTKPTIHRFPQKRCPPNRPSKRNPSSTTGNTHRGYGAYAGRGRAPTRGGRGDGVARPPEHPRPGEPRRRAAEPVELRAPDHRRHRRRPEGKEAGRLYEEEGGGVASALCCAQEIWCGLLARSRGRDSVRARRRVPGLPTDSQPTV